MDPLSRLEPSPPDIVLVGRYPPPYGGNTAHIERLAHKLRDDGISVTVIDLYRFAVADVQRGLSEQSWTFLNKCQLIYFLCKRSAGAIIHFHMSAGNKFYLVAPILFTCTSRSCKRVLTIHSGSWEEEFHSLHFPVKQVAVAVLSVFNDIICVNSRQKEALSGKAKGRLHVLPAYLPPVAEVAKKLPENVETFLRETDIVLATSGYGTPIYDYVTITRALEIAQEQTSEKLGLIVATYASWDQKYWPATLQRLESSSISIEVTKDLTPAQFVSVLSRARIYIRSTSTDGDAVAIREAASVGNQVLASNSVPRAKGCAIFRNGDAEHLSELIVNAISNRNIGSLPPESHQDNYAAIREIYGLS